MQRIPGSILVLWKVYKSLLNFYIVPVVSVFYTESVFTAESEGNIHCAIKNATIFIQRKDCRCFSSPKTSFCDRHSRLQCVYKKEQPYWCIKNEKVVAVCLVLKRHFGPESDVLICAFAARCILFLTWPQIAGCCAYSKVHLQLLV